ncbi:MAG: MBL fold metallo-hydrolase [Phycisphaerales bacterium]
MNVLILGTGDAFSRRSFGSSALVQAPDGYILLDCPDPIHRVIHEATTKHNWNVDAGAIDDIIVTHLHGDHSNGLESFGFHRRIAAMQNPGAHPKRPRLHATQPVLDRLWEKLAPAMDSPMGGSRPSQLADYFEVNLLTPGTVARIAGVNVSCRFTRHPIPTIGLKIAAGSRVLGWSGDTAFEQEHIDWLSDADVIVHESNLGAAHTSLDALEALPEALRKRLRLIHTPDDLKPEATTLHVLTDRELLMFE